MSEYINTWTEQSIGTTLTGRIRLNRPSALHAMDQNMVRSINSALNLWKHDETISMVLVDHAPESRGFCAGGDIRKLAAAETTKVVSSFVASECSLAASIKNFPKPYIAVMDGVVMGAGLGLAIHGSHRIATENTKMAMPEVGIGLFPDTGVAWHLARLPDRIGVWMAATGAQLTGEQAFDTKMATHYLAADSIDAVKTALVAHGPDALEDFPTLPHSGLPTTHKNLIASLFASDEPNAIMTALNTSSDPWAHEQAATMAGKCPMSIHIALRHLTTTASNDNFDALMRAEHALVCAMAARSDFAEGVRAAIIDKDGNPKWSPAHLEDISAATIDDIFAYRPAKPWPH